MEVPAIEDSIDPEIFNGEIPSVVDRYYEHKYYVKHSKNDENLDQCVSFHSNRMCLISLAEHHPVMLNKKNVIKINCVVENIDRLKNAASGKSKRGAQKLSPNSVLCYVECDDNTKYPVYSCIEGKLIEINSNLIDNPNLLVSKPRSNGYIALILPLLSVFNAQKESMLVKEQYFALRGSL